MPSVLVTAIKEAQTVIHTGFLSAAEASKHHHSTKKLNRAASVPDDIKASKVVFVIRIKQTIKNMQKLLRRSKSGKGILLRKAKHIPTLPKEKRKDRMFAATGMLIPIVANACNNNTQRIPV